MAVKMEFTVGKGRIRIFDDCSEECTREKKEEIAAEVSELICAYQRKKKYTKNA